MLSLYGALQSSDHTPFLFCHPSRRAGGAFDGVSEEKTPFGYKRGEGIDAGYGEVEWICAKDREKTDPIFRTLNPIDGKITGESEYRNFGLPI